jgi:predicted Zn-dependent protease
MKRLLVAVSALLLIGRVAFAGLDGQPKPSDETIARLRTTVRQFQISDGDRGKARPDLILLVERDPTADVTDLLSPALVDPIAYNGLVSTFDDALQTAEAGTPKSNFLLYNLARLHLLYARAQPEERQRRPYLDAAARVATKLPENLRDPVAWELRGDIEVERGDMNAAAAIYSKLASMGGGPGLAGYKTGLAYQKARRWTQAETAFQGALRAEAAAGKTGSLLYHYLWQAMGSLYLETRRDKDAVAALGQSARLKAPEIAGHRLQTGLARLLLARGYRKEVAAYADAGLKLTPNDPELEQLRSQTGGS